MTEVKLTQQQVEDATTALEIAGAIVKLLRDASVAKQWVDEAQLRLRHLGEAVIAPLPENSLSSTLLVMEQLSLKIQEARSMLENAGTATQ
jgi:hypothetical protein